jgi:hypothetical protein
MRVETTIDRIAHLSAREYARIAGANGGRNVQAPDKVDALREVSRVLDGIGVAHAVVGGVAVGIRSGVPRATPGYRRCGALHDPASRRRSGADRRRIHAPRRIRSQRELS